jgi:hypothetical protein
VEISFKGTLSQGFFMNHLPPRPLKITLGSERGGITEEENFKGAQA